MILTILLTFALMILLFLSIWMATIFMPFAVLAKNFPEDIQERLEPRLAELEKRPFKEKIIGQIIFILCMSAILVVMLIGGIDGFYPLFRMEKSPVKNWLLLYSMYQAEAELFCCAVFHFMILAFVSSDMQLSDFRLSFPLV